jgi:hypothetical protein
MNTSVASKLFGEMDQHTLRTFASWPEYSRPRGNMVVGMYTLALAPRRLLVSLMLHRVA